MAVIATTKAYRVTIKQNAGTHEGKTLTKSTSLGTLSVGADQQKIMNVANALEPCLANTIYSIEETTIKVLSE